MSDEPFNGAGATLTVGVANRPTVTVEPGQVVLYLEQDEPVIVLRPYEAMQLGDELIEKAREALEEAVR